MTMHRIEDIIRQLNAVSAHIQPELADHLRQIQERLDRAHAQVARPQHTLAASPVAAATVGSATVGSATVANGEFATSAVAASRVAPALAQVSLAAAGVSSTPEPSVARPSDRPVIVAASASAVALELMDELIEEIDALEEVAVNAVPSNDPVKALGDIRNQVAAQQAIAAVAAPAPVTQPHEPTTPHFLRGTTGSRPGVEPAPAVDGAAPRRTAQRADVVQLQAMVTEPESASKLPLFESLWFRQAAPQSFTARIVDRLLQKMPSTVPAVLHFCQDQFSQADSPLICTQIAWELSRRGVGQVLLVDADFDHREISRQLGNVYLPGLSEALNLGEPLDGLVRPTGVQALSWLPSGAGDLSFRKIAGGRLAEISLEFRQRFQWICVHAGAAQDRVTAAWGRFCDYSYLIASMADDLGQPTKQVLEGLRAAECRVSGLITID